MVTGVQTCALPISDPAWKQDYSNIARIPPAEVARLRDEFQRQKEIAQALRAAPG